MTSYVGVIVILHKSHYGSHTRTLYCSHRQFIKTECGLTGSTGVHLNKAHYLVAIFATRTNPWWRDSVLNYCWFKICQKMWMLQLSCDNRASTYQKCKTGHQLRSLVFWLLSKGFCSKWFWQGIVERKCLKIYPLVQVKSYILCHICNQYYLTSNINVMSTAVN